MFAICPKRKTSFLHIPKNGVESIRLLILSEQQEENPHLIWSPNYTKYSKKNIPTDHNLIVISRNPYDRLVSGYIDKFLTGNFNLLKFCKKPMKFYKRKMNSPNRINFEEFVNYLITLPPNSVDDHFKPQHLFHSTPKCKSINIFKLEEINKINTKLKKFDFEHSFDNYKKIHLYSQLKKSTPNAHKLYYPQFDIAENRKDPVKPDGAAGVGFWGATLPEYKDFYTDELRKKVYTYYKKDFDLFNYPIH